MKFLLKASVFGYYFKFLDCDIVLTFSSERVLIEGFELALYPWLPLFPHDCNIAMTCLLLSLCRYMAVHGNCLPDVCFILMDNATSENKNNFVLSFMALLVRPCSVYLCISCCHMKYIPCEQVYFTESLC
jgi:hypothetical protein